MQEGEGAAQSDEALLVVEPELLATTMDKPDDAADPDLVIEGANRPVSAARGLL